MYAQPKWMTILGWVLTALIVALLFLSAYFKFNPSPEIAKEMTEKMGYRLDTIFIIGFVEVACALIYLFPQTAVFGAVLLMAYLGGATATHVRIGEPFIVPVVVGVIMWLGIYLREPRLRAILPWRTLPPAVVTVTK